jgi:hypothetical protein
MPSVTPEGTLSPLDVFGGGMPVPLPDFLKPIGEVEEEEDEEVVSNANALKFAGMQNAFAAARA